LETYRRATRYITITGNPLPDFAVPLKNIDAHIDTVVAELDRKKKNKQNGGGPTVLEGLEAEADAGKGTSTAPEDNYRLPQEMSLMLYMQGDAPAHYPSRSELFYAFIKAALRRGVDENMIVSVCLDTTYAGCSIFSHVHDNGGEPYVKRQIERAANDGSDSGQQTTNTTGDDQRQTIRVEVGKLDEAWRETQRALIKAGCPIYVRGGQLVQPLWRFEKTSEGNRDVLTAQFVTLNEPRLRSRNSALAARSSPVVMPLAEST
jgi:hypothetical protein